MKIFGIEFAPIFIALERRLQTAAVFYFCINIIFFGFFMLYFCLYLLFTKYYFVPLLYLAWLIYDHKKCCQGGRRFEWYRRLRLWKYYTDYFPISMIKSADLDPNKNYIFGYHPHGILSHGAFSCFATEATNFSEVFPGITPRMLLLKGQFWFPFNRERAMSTGACAATKESIEWILSKEGKGNAVILVIGGAAEALNAHPGTVSLVLKNRRGFIRLALKLGASLVPVFAFGENDLYHQLENPQGSLLRKIQNKLKEFMGFSLPIYHGRGIFQYNYGLIPYRVPIHVIIGEPIDVEKIPEPTEDDVSKLHEIYVEKLMALFEEHKLKYNSKDVKLIIS